MTEPEYIPGSKGRVGQEPGAEAVLAQLDRLLLSRELGRSVRMKGFLRFVVNETLAGRAARLKEYAIAVEVFGRDPSFDPRTSAIVRVEASRLRRRLREYALGVGRGDPIRIELAAGTYVPQFSVRAPTGAKARAVGAGTIGADISARRFAGTPDDPLAVRDQDAQTIIAGIGSILGGLERERARRKKAEELDAWDSYQRGMWHLFRFTAVDCAKGRRFLGRAIELDPSWATARAGLAYAHFVDVSGGFSTAPEVSAEQAYHAAQAAVALDANDPMARFARGRAYQLMSEFDAAVADMACAINLDPSFALAHLGLAHTLAWAGRPEQAIQAADGAERLSRRDPWLWAIENIRAVARTHLGQYEMAVRDARAASRRPNAGSWSYVNLTAALGHLGRDEEARRLYGKVLQMKPAFSVASALLEHSPLHPDHRFEHLERTFEGLCKAGLDIADRPPPRER